MRSKTSFWWIIPVAALGIAILLPIYSRPETSRKPIASAPGRPPTHVQDNSLLEEHKFRSPASPADPHQYAEGWQMEIAGIKGVNNPVVVVWRDKIFVGYRQAEGVKKAATAEAVTKKIRDREPQFRTIVVTSKTEDYAVLQKTADLVKHGRPPAEFITELEGILRKASK